MKKSTKLLDKMLRERKGRVLPAWKYLCEIDPEFLEAYNGVAVLNFNYGTAAKQRALSGKMKELIAVALLAAVRGDTIGQHIKTALAHGASKREVVEALEMSMQITGAPSLEFGLKRLMEIEREP